MTSRARLADANAEARSVFAPYIDATLPQTDRYRLDPWAHVNDGHVLVQDGVTMRPVIWKPYQHQVELVEAWIDLDTLQATAREGMPVVRFRNTLEEKSRQMGITWGLAWPILWLLMYHQVSLLCIHEELSELDDGPAHTTKSLFGRIRYMAEGMLEPGRSVWPDALQPSRYLDWSTRPSKITNRLRGGFIHAEGQGPSPGRGGRFHAVLLDEAARIKWSESVHASVIRACPDGLLYNSTPYGTGNAYGRLVKTRPANFQFLRHHWSIHPVYSRGLHVAGAEPETCELCAGNERGDRWEASGPTCHRYPGKLTSPWFDREVQSMTSEQVAQELEIDYTGAITGRVYPEFSDDVHVVDRIDYDPALPIITSWDFGPAHTAIGVFQQAVDELRQIGELEVTDAYPEKVVDLLVDYLAELGVPLIELGAQFTREWLSVGDVSAEQRTSRVGAETLATAYGKLGFTIQSKLRGIDESIRATKRVLQGAPCKYRISRDHCPGTIDHWRENKWETDREGKIRPNAAKPKNDEHNHLLRGIAYLFTWMFPSPSVDEAMQQASSGSFPSVLDDFMELDDGYRDHRDGGGTASGLRPDMGL